MDKDKKYYLGYIDGLTKAINEFEQEIEDINKRFMIKIKRLDKEVEEIYKKMKEDKEIEK